MDGFAAACNILHRSLQHQQRETTRCSASAARRREPPRPLDLPLPPHAALQRTPCCNAYTACIPPLQFFFFFVDEGCIRRISLQAAKRFHADPEKRKSYDKYGEADMADFNMEEFMEHMFADDGMFGHRTLLPPSLAFPPAPPSPLSRSLARSRPRASRSVLGSPQFCGHAF